MNDQQLPAGPWRWERVIPEGQDREHGRALVAADGTTWIVSSEDGQVEEARGWARGYEHGMFVNVDTDEPPVWLTAPLEADGE